MKQQMDLLYKKVTPGRVSQLLSDLRPDNSISTLPAKKSSQIISDVDILESLAPDYLAGLDSESYWSFLYIASHAIRHCVCFLNLLCHEAALDSSCDYSRIDVLKNYMTSTFRDCGAWKAGVEIRTINNTMIVPSALGIHIFMLTPGECAYFSPYDRQSCGIPCDESGIFCAQHKNELWWAEDEVDPGSPLAVTLRAHSFRYPQNLSEEDLESLVDSFFANFRSRSSVEPSVDYPEALSHYGYQTLSEVEQLGEGHLRRLFLQKVKIEHPDCGGKKEDFVLSKRYYDCLRLYL